MAHYSRFHARLLALIILVLPATVAAAGGHVHLPFIRKPKGRPGPRMSKRDVSMISTEDNPSPYAFVAEVRVGTPPQKMELTIMTSTGQSWVQDAQSSICKYHSNFKPLDENRRSKNCILGSFNKTFSSSYQKANQQYASFMVELPGRVSVPATNFTDNLVVGNMEFPNMAMGLVTVASVGALGLGFNFTSSSYGYYDYGSHPSFMDRMVRDDHITTRAFSMWLDDAKGGSGNLLFGAVDQSKYDGHLVRVKATNEFASPGTFGVTIAGLSFSSNADSEMKSFPSNDFPLGVTFGPGELLSYLPSRIYNKLVEVTGATFNSSLGLAMIPCDAAKTNNAKFSFRLSGPEGPMVNFEMDDLVVPYNWSTAYYPSRDAGNSLCILGVQKRQDDGSSSYSKTYFNLGSSILRRTFSTFDLENREVAVAPAKFASKSDEASPTIVAFESSGAPVPSATLYCHLADPACKRYCNGYPYPCESHPTSTIGPGAPGGGGGSNWGGGGSNWGGEESFRETTYWRNVAIGVGVGLGLFLLIGGICIAILFKRVIRREPPKGNDVEEDGSEAEAPGPGPETSAPGSTGTRMEAPPPDTLPVIREGREDVDSGAPQLPVLSKGLGNLVTPPEPLTPSNRDSAAVSALFQEDAPAPQTNQAAVSAVEGDAPVSQTGQATRSAVEVNASNSSKGNGAEVVDNRHI